MRQVKAGIYLLIAVFALFSLSQEAFAEDMAPEKALALKSFVLTLPEKKAECQKQAFEAEGVDEYITAAIRKANQDYGICLKEIAFELVEKFYPNYRQDEVKESINKTIETKINAYKNIWYCGYSSCEGTFVHGEMGSAQYEDLEILIPKMVDVFDIWSSEFTEEAWEERWNNHQKPSSNHVDPNYVDVNKLFPPVDSNK